MRIVAVLIAIIMSLSLTAPVAAKGVSSSRSSSRPASTSRPSSKPSSPPPSRPAPKVWSSSTKYGLGAGVLVGTGALKSKTTPPKSHNYKGTNYNSSAAPYTNTHGLWVFYWIASGHSTTCYDKDHKRITCDRDKKSYATNW